MKKHAYPRKSLPCPGLKTGSYFKTPNKSLVLSSNKFSIAGSEREKIEIFFFSLHY